jgi:hypothetical protein
MSPERRKKRFPATHIASKGARKNETYAPDMSPLAQLTCGASVHRNSANALRGRAIFREFI